MVVCFKYGDMDMDINVLDRPKIEEPKLISIGVFYLVRNREKEGIWDVIWTRHHKHIGYIQWVGEESIHECMDKYPKFMKDMSGVMKHFYGLSNPEFKQELVTEQVWGKEGDRWEEWYMEKYPRVTTAPAYNWGYVLGSLDVWREGIYMAERGGGIPPRKRANFFIKL